jgi:hypothetical protein
VPAGGAHPTKHWGWRRISTRVQGWQAALGAVTTFREAARLLDELAGIQVGSETLRTQAERIGTELEGQQRAVMDSVEVAHEPPAAEHDPARGVLVVETDGVMVRYRDRRLDGALVEGDWGRKRHDAEHWMWWPGIPGMARQRSYARWWCWVMAPGGSGST